MLCAGVTTYAALRKSGAKSGQWVVISGAGGGLGHIAVQLASKGMALRVIGIDSADKEQLARDCGAEHFIAIDKHPAAAAADDDGGKSMAEEVVQTAGGLGASAVIVCTASNAAYAQALDLVRFNSSVVCVGIPDGEPKPLAKAYPGTIVSKQATVTAVAVGNRRDAVEVMDFAARGIVKPRYRVGRLDKLTEVRFCFSQNLLDRKMRKKALWGEGGFG